MPTEVDVRKINELIAGLPLKSSSDFSIRVDDAVSISVEPVRNENGFLFLDCRIYGLDRRFDYELCVKGDMYTLGVDGSENCHRAKLYVQESPSSWRIHVLAPVESGRLVHVHVGGESEQIRKLRSFEKAGS